MPTGPATMSMRPSTVARRQQRLTAQDASTAMATTPPITERPTPTWTGLKDASAAVVAGKVTLKNMTPSTPSASGAAFLPATEVLLLALMNNDSSSASVASRIEDLVQSMPPGSRLPSYRDLQQRYRLSPATVQRMLADLSRRGLLVTRPGSGTYTAPRRQAPAAADVSWQTLALGSRTGLSVDLERLVDPGAPDALPLTSGFLDERLQPLGLLAAVGARAARRPQAWSRLPPQGLPELRAFFAAETGGTMTGQNVLSHPAARPRSSAVFRHLCAPGDPVILESPTYVGAHRGGQGRRADAGARARR